MEKQEKIQLIKKMAIEVLQQATEPLPTVPIHNKILSELSNKQMELNNTWGILKEVLKEDTQTFLQYAPKGRGRRDYWLSSRGEYKGAIKVSDKNNPDISGVNEELKQKIMQFAEERIKEKFLQKIGNEIETRDKLINPFLQILGYDSQDPDILKAEENADFGDRKNKKIDYIAFKNDKPIMLIEAKLHQAELKKCIEQIRQYFTNKVSNGVEIYLALLTNGIEYQFFSDLDKENVLDTEPFFVFNLKNFSNKDIAMLENFIYDKIDVKKIKECGKQRRIYNLILLKLKEQIENPDKEFVKFFLKNIDGISGPLNKVVVKFQDDVKMAFEEIFRTKNQQIK